MPDKLGLCDVVAVYQWPLGKVKTRMAAGECWTDVIVELDSAIRLGGRYNTRRVRYDGVFYIVHNARRVVFDQWLAREAFEVATWVYGDDGAADVVYNSLLRGC